MFLVFEVRYTLHAASSIIGNYTRTLQSINLFHFVARRAVARSFCVILTVT